MTQTIEYTRMNEMTNVASNQMTAWEQKYHDITELYALADELLENDGDEPGCKHDSSLLHGTLGAAFSQFRRLDKATFLEVQRPARVRGALRIVRDDNERLPEFPA